jgi:hypothetical protein
LCDHRHQRLSFNIKALNPGVAPVRGEAQQDVVMHLRPRAIGASQKGLTSKFGPPHTVHLCERMPHAERDKQSLGPQWLRMAIASLWRSNDKSDVKPCLANLANGVARAPLHDLQIDGRMLFTKLTQKFRKKTCRNGRVQTDTEPTLLAARNRARGPHGMIEVLDAGGNVFEKVLPSVSRTPR